MSTTTVGILGGGQLGRMLAAEASLLNINIRILDPSPSSPAKQILASTSHITGSFTDPSSIRELAGVSDVITVEIEHVNADILKEIEAGGKKVHPNPGTIKLLQDKYTQKQHLANTGSPISPYSIIKENTEEAISRAGTVLGWPLMLKSRTLAYDGRGNHIVHSPSDIPSFLSSPLGSAPLYAEKLLPFSKEIAVMVVRSIDGSVLSYPVVETIQKDNICHMVLVPLRGKDASLEKRARDVAEHAVKGLEGAGVFGVEMFLMSDGKCLSWIMTRVFRFGNIQSGVWTIEWDR